MTFSWKIFLIIAFSSFAVGFASWKVIYRIITTEGEKSYDRGNNKYSVNVDGNAFLAGLFVVFVFEFVYFDELRISRLIESGFFD